MRRFGAVVVSQPVDVLTHPRIGVLAEDNDVPQRWRIPSLMDDINRTVIAYLACRYRQNGACALGLHAFKCLLAERFGPGCRGRRTLMLCTSFKSPLVQRNLQSALALKSDSK